MKRLFLLFAAASFVMTVGILWAQEPAGTGNGGVRSIELPVVPVVLKQAAGVDKASTLCNICHSLDYITMQPAFPRATWTAEVNKMIKVMGAPINEEDGKTIIDYLSANYGTGQ